MDTTSCEMRFAMVLPPDRGALIRPQFRTGILCLCEGLAGFNQSPQLVNQVRATSGCSGAQKFGSYWVRGQSPIPPGVYKVDTTMLTATESKKVPMGTNYFHIEPDPIINSDDPRLIRTEICLHYDGGALGTAGCIGVQPRRYATEPGWYVVLGWVLRMREKGFKSIPLSVSYEQGA